MQYITLKKLVALVALFAAVTVGLMVTVTGAGAVPAAGAESSNIVFLPLIRADVVEPPAPTYDMVDFLTGDGRLYEVQHSSGSQARHQTQVEGVDFFHTKGNEIHAEWEELWYDDAYIYRGTDTSPGNGMYYTLRDPGMYGSAWSPRHWAVGDLFYRNPLVTFYEKSNCSVVTNGTQGSYLLFEDYHATFEFDSGIVLDDVVQLAWLLSPHGEPVERYFYASDYGLVGWASSDHGMSYVSELHAPGARPNNTREVIPCMNTEPAGTRDTWPGPLPFWPGNHRR